MLLILYHVIRRTLCQWKLKIFVAQTGVVNKLGPCCYSGHRVSHFKGRVLRSGILRLTIQEGTGQDQSNDRTALLFTGMLVKLKSK